MCKCVRSECGRTFEDGMGFNPFYCSYYCSEINNRDKEVLKDSFPKKSAVLAQKKAKVVDEVKVVRRTRINSNNILNRAWC